MWNPKIYPFPSGFSMYSFLAHVSDNNHNEEPRQNLPIHTQDTEAEAAQVSGQYGLYGKTLSQKQNKTKRKSAHS
jgi:hypothetical protein